MKLPRSGSCLVFFLVLCSWSFVSTYLLVVVDTTCYYKPILPLVSISSSVGGLKNGMGSTFTSHYNERKACTCVNSGCFSNLLPPLHASVSISCQVIVSNFTLPSFLGQPLTDVTHTNTKCYPQQNCE